MSNSTSEIDSLFTTQEEADTRMLLHAKHAADKSSSTIIASEDTDMFIICLSLVQTFACQMYNKCAPKNREDLLMCRTSLLLLVMTYAQCSSWNAFPHRM